MSASNQGTPHDSHSPSVSSPGSGKPCRQRDPNRPLVLSQQQGDAQTPQDEDTRGRKRQRPDPGPNPSQSPQSSVSTRSPLEQRSPDPPPVDSSSSSSSTMLVNLRKLLRMFATRLNGLPNGSDPMEVLEINEDVRLKLLAKFHKVWDKIPIGHTMLLEVFPLALASPSMFTSTNLVTRSLCYSLIPSLLFQKKYHPRHYSSQTQVPLPWDLLPTIKPKTKASPEFIKINSSPLHRSPMCQDEPERPPSDGASVASVLTRKQKKKVKDRLKAKNRKAEARKKSTPESVQAGRRAFDAPSYLPSDDEGPLPDVAPARPTREKPESKAKKDRPQNWDYRGPSREALLLAGRDGQRMWCGPCLLSNKLVCQFRGWGNRCATCDTNHTTGCIFFTSEPRKSFMRDVLYLQGNRSPGREFYLPISVSFHELSLS
ncbi:hypothetical protein BDN72DRAFT_906978 [Pluteus cervinus]|uniref:Uncharacterized protein n=1 Tax=Pluteus cervinus TaxID=181527 RepID=A0ACD2ZXY6_9AGAR|nr:hypothetical protein BDN72DRAFT_906978 [Pluteus cervinus]